MKNKWGIRHGMCRKFIIKGDFFLRGNGKICVVSNEARKPHVIIFCKHVKWKTALKEFPLNKLTKSYTVFAFDSFTSLKAHTVSHMEQIYMKSEARGMM